MPKSTKVTQLHLPECNSAQIRQILLNFTKFCQICAKIRQNLPNFCQNSPNFVSQKGSNFEHPNVLFRLIDLLLSFTEPLIRQFYKTGFKSVIIWTHSEGHPPTEGTFTGTLVNVGDLRQNSGERREGSPENSVDNVSEAWGPPQFQEKRSRSEKAILGALGEFRGILGAALGIGNSILGMASHDLINTKPAILGATLGAIPGIAANPPERFSFAPAFSERFFKNWGGPRAPECGFAKARQSSPQFARARMKVHACFWYAPEPASIIQEKPSGGNFGKDQK